MDDYIYYFLKRKFWPASRMHPDVIQCCPFTFGLYLDTNPSPPTRPFLPSRLHRKLTFEEKKIKTCVYQTCLLECCSMCSIFAIPTLIISFCITVCVYIVYICSVSTFFYRFFSFFVVPSCIMVFFSSVYLLFSYYMCIFVHPLCDKRKTINCVCVYVWRCSLSMYLCPDLYTVVFVSTHV